MSSSVEAPVRERHISRTRVLVGGNLGFSNDEKHGLVREVIGISGRDPAKDRTGLIGGFRPVLRSSRDEEGPEWEIDRMDEPVGIIDFLRLQPRLILLANSRRNSIHNSPITSDTRHLYTINLDEQREVREEHLTAMLEEAFLAGRRDLVDKILNEDKSLDAKWSSRINGP